MCPCGMCPEWHCQWNESLEGGLNWIPGQKAAPVLKQAGPLRSGSEAGHNLRVANFMCEGHVTSFAAWSKSKNTLRTLHFIACHTNQT